MTLTWEPSTPARKSCAEAGSTSAILVMPETPLRMLDQYCSGSCAPGRTHPRDTIAIGVSVDSSRGYSTAGLLSRVICAALPFEPGTESGTAATTFACSRTGTLSAKEGRGFGAAPAERETSL